MTIYNYLCSFNLAIYP